jgi:histidinol phosphatase-like PHP family hydrolase
VEVTHCPPEQIAKVINEARALGAKLILVHGETLAEPVKPGTDMAAILAGADVLAHPGLITEEEAAMAAKKGVCLEISFRSGHSLSNGHVAARAKAAGADLVFGTDTHSPDNISTLENATLVARGAGLTPREVEGMFERARRFFGTKR